MTTVCMYCRFVEDCFHADKAYVSEAQQEIDRIDNGSQRAKRQQERIELWKYHAELVEKQHRKCQIGGGDRLFKEGKA